MDNKEHEDLHLKNDIRNFLKLIIQNATKYPFQISKSAIDLKVRMDEQDKIKGE